ERGNNQKVGGQACLQKDAIDTTALFRPKPHGICPTLPVVLRTHCGHVDPPSIEDMTMSEFVIAPVTTPSLADGVDIQPEDALSHVWGYGVGLDLTRRDLQAQAKKMGRPWEWAKAFDASAPATALLPVSKIGHPDKGSIWLDVNGESRQRGDLADQIWAVKDVIAYLSQSVGVKAGDLIYTGTPAGVGALQRGDVVTAGIEGIAELTVTLV
nr:acylpyruvase FAHD1, mitochondrial [Tanacetum cinerariifolium]